MKREKFSAQSKVRAPFARLNVQEGREKMQPSNSLVLCLVTGLIVFPFVKGWLVQRVKAFSKTLVCVDRTSGHDMKLLSNRQVDSASNVLVQTFTNV